MQMQIQSMKCLVAVTAALFTLFGCTEEVSPTQPQVQTQPAPTTEQQAVMEGTAAQGGGSALGGAKRASENIIQQAQEQSQKVGEQADGNQEPE